MPDLLIELFSEEIPAGMQQKAMSDLKKGIADGLTEAGLAFSGAEAFATPRRLALAVDGLPSKSPGVTEERKGPRIDAPEKAIEGFSRSAGLAREELEVGEDEKGGFYVARISRPGRKAETIVAETLKKVVLNFPWQKSMRWGNGSLRWARPLHSILCLLSNSAGEAEVVDVDIDGVKSGNATWGHRSTGTDRIAVVSFEDYVRKLKRAHVMLDPMERAASIRHDIENLAFAVGLEVVEDKKLLAEVAGLVEWPMALMGEISEEFLLLPSEVIVTSMREHQKFFSARNPKTGRIERFITIANCMPDDGGETILAGNRKVLSARLADAKFFWENDLRVAGDGGFEWLDALKNVTFERRLGTQYERIARLELLSGLLASHVGASEDMARLAARWAKADLSSEMVNEFPELQGVMGQYYAKAIGLPAEVGHAARHHYSPVGPSDEVPASPVSIAVAIADKLDTLCGFWIIDEKPTGSKDPFALRRAALGIIRLILDNDVRISLSRGIDEAMRLILGCLLLKGNVAVDDEFAMASGKHDATGKGDNDANELRDSVAAASNRINGSSITLREKVVLKHVGKSSCFREVDVGRVSFDLMSFIHERLKVYLREEGIRHDVIDACSVMRDSDDLSMLVKRAKALQDVLATENGENLVHCFRRANNILKQAEAKDGVLYSSGADISLAASIEESDLFASLDEAENRISEAVQKENYAGAMKEMAQLRKPIDAFFESVQINAEEKNVRINRLNLLNRIRRTCLKAADLTLVES